MRDPETTPELTEVLTGGGVAQRSKELEQETDLADRMDDGAWGLADGELGQGGPSEEEKLEPLPADIRADQLERRGFSTAEDADLTGDEAPIDLRLVDGNLRGPGEASISALRDGGERVAPVADASAYRPDGPITAAPTRKS